MAARGARQRKQRISIMRETALGVGDTATIKHIPGLRDVAYTTDQDMFADGSQTHDRVTELAPWLGEKKNTLAFKTPVHKNLILTMGDSIEASLGGVRSNTGITVNPASVTLTQFTFTAGVPDDWVIITYASGRKVYRPVSRTNGTTAFFAYQLDTITGVAAVQNASQFGATTGKTYYEEPNAQFLSLQAQMDRPGEPDKEDNVLKGMVPNLCEWSMGLGDRLFLNVAYQGTSWKQETGANLANPLRPSKHAAPWQVEAWILSDYDSPGAAPARTPIVSYKVNLAPTWFPISATQDRGGSDEATIPDSSVIEWRRQEALGNGEIEIVTAFASTAWKTAFAAETDFQIALVAYLGNPGSTSFSGDAMCLYLPKCRLKVQPSVVNNGGADGQRLLFHARDERDVGTSAGQMSSNLIKKAAFTNFIS